LAFNEKCKCSAPTCYFSAYSEDDKEFLRGEISLSGDGCGDSNEPALIVEMSDSRLHIHANSNNGSTLFGQTVILESPQCRISRIKIIKGIGITEFFDIEQNCLWKNIN
jgi:hypothetical protein